jgi:hypothetical protein
MLHGSRKASSLEAFKSEISFEMQKIKDSRYCLFFSLFLMLVLAYRSLLSKICFNVIFILKRGKNEKNNNNWPP